MKAYVATNIIGVFAFDEKGKIISKKLFPKNPEAIAERLEKSRNGNLIEEEREILAELKKSGCKEAIMDKNAHVDGVKILCESENKGKEIATNEFRRLALESKWAESQAELNTIMTKVNILLAGQRIKTVSKDKVIMQVIGVIDEMDVTLNSLSERLREWYGLHFPELSREVKSHQRFAEIVEMYGNKENIKEKDIETFARKSVGIDFSEDDAESVKAFSKTLIELFRTREKLSRYLENVCRKTMPNLSAVAGPLLASRLVAQAGGLEKIAKLPSSTIQLLGAEKALFRHLRGQGKAPKYGVLFSHPLIQQTPKPLKGKVARLIASKLSLAAKMDFYSKRDDSKQMGEDLKKRVKALIKSSGGDENQ